MQTPANHAVFLSEPDSVRRSYLLFLPVIAFMYIMSALFLR